MIWLSKEVHTVDIEFNPSGIYGKTRHRTWFSQVSGKYETKNVPAENARSDEIAGFYGALAGNKYQDWTDEVRIQIDTQRPCAKSTPKYKQGAPDLEKPDVDNTAKQVLDALKGIAWKDDQQITKLTIQKHPRFMRRNAYMRIRITYIQNTLTKG